MMLFIFFAHFVITKNKKDYDSIRYRQFNEILLSCNERIVTEEFFRFLSRGNKNKIPKIKFRDFKNKVTNFQKLAMLQFGSFRFAYNYLSNKKNIENKFVWWISNSKDIVKNFKRRIDPIRNIEKINEKDLSILGYLTKDDQNQQHCEKIRRQGQKNFDTYLTWDYLDVYVATSMRKDWEFIDISKFCEQVFQDKKLKSLKVRYFDPTQNFHENSIAKGLIEGLMLKRAKCTLYLVQETDTMGKASEMAATLAQGKPVIAYVPKYNIKERIKELSKLDIGYILDKAAILRYEVKDEVKEYIISTYYDKEIRISKYEVQEK